MFCLAVKLDGPHAMRGALIGISLALADGDACYVPLRHRPAGGQGALDLASGAGPDLRVADPYRPKSRPSSPGDWAPSRAWAISAMLENRWAGSIARA